MNGNYLHTKQYIAKFSCDDKGEPLEMAEGAWHTPYSLSSCSSGKKLLVTLRKAYSRNTGSWHGNT